MCRGRQRDVTTAAAYPGFDSVSLDRIIHVRSIWRPAAEHRLDAVQPESDLPPARAVSAKRGASVANSSDHPRRHVRSRLCPRE
jgi:hypothetical protein